MLGPAGTVESEITLFVSTDESDAPYTVGMIRMDDGPTLLSRIAGVAGVGAHVRVLADLEAGAFWFVPTSDSNSAAHPHAA